MTSLMINLDSEAQFFTEIEEYTGDTVMFGCKLEEVSIQPFLFQLFSDIGGAAGLILGMSFSTIVSILDWFISMLARFIHLQIQRCLNKL